MTLTIQVSSVPIHLNAQGVALVGQTRVTLETVIGAYQRGALPEAIVLQYPALTLAEVYQVVGYYLEHQAEVNAYLEEQRAASEQARREIAAREDLVGIRARLLARREQSER